MERETDSIGGTRYLGIDLHKHYLVIGGVNGRQETVLTPRRVELDAWAVWTRTYLRRTDVLVVEATGNTWAFYDQVVDLVARVEVANAGKLPWIGQTKVKTDKQDVMKLAKLCAAGLIPQVWVPPTPVRELRMLFSHRRRLVKVSTLVKNRLQSLLHRQQLAAPSGEAFSQANRAWWEQLTVSATERLHVKHDLATLQQVAEQLADVEAELNRLSVYPPNGLGSAFYKNPEFDKIMEQSRLEQNTEKRKALLVQGAKIVWEECPWLWLHVEKFLIAYSSKIQNMPVTPTELFFPTYITMK